MPVSLISTTSVAAVCDLVRVEPNALRFRPNFLVAPESGAPYAEEDLVGYVLQIGTTMVRIDRRDTRCVIVDVDPRTGRPDAKLLKQLGKHRDTLAGVYGTVELQPGHVEVTATP